MKITSMEDICNLVKSFEERTIAHSDWTHAAHLSVGFYYVQRLPFAVAKNVMRDGIHWLNDRHGIPNTATSGYHETLTVFWLKRIWNFLDSRPDRNDLPALANQLISVYNDSRFPLGFYSRQLLFSAEARRDYYPPDLHVRPAFNYTITLAILKPLL